jgi:hypothetical protein
MKRFANRNKFCKTRPIVPSLLLKMPIMLFCIASLYIADLPDDLQKPEQIAKFFESL